MKIIDLINLYRLGDITRIEIRKNNWFVLEAEKVNIPDYINNKQVEDFCFNNDKLVVNYAEDEVEEVEDKEYEDIEEIIINSCGNIEKKLIDGSTIVLPTTKDEVLHIAYKINALIRNQKYILEQLNKESK